MRRSICLLIAAFGGFPAMAAGPRAASIDLAYMTTAELHDRLGKGCPIALVYNAGIDETGPHVALGKHIFRANAYGRAIARRLDDAILAPVIPFAPNGPPSVDLPGEIALRPATYVAINEDLIRSLVGGGFRRVAILPEHGVGLDDLKTLAERLDAEFKPRNVRIFYAGDVYSMARLEIERDIKASGRVAGGHGGLWDTAETMAVDPAAVRPRLFALGTTAEDGNGATNAAGFSGDPRGATAALGRRFGERRVRLAVHQIRGLLSTAGPCH